jgi:hypothetical protein
MDNQLYLQFEELTDSSERLFRQLQRFLSTPVMKFNAVLDKPVYSISVLFKFFWQAAITTTMAAGILYLIRWIGGGELYTLSNVLGQVATNPIFQLAILLLLFINIRAVIFRLSDKEI